MAIDFVCSVCSETFHDKGGLKKHMHVHDTGKKDKTYRKTTVKEEQILRKPSERKKTFNKSYKELSLSPSPSPKSPSLKSESNKSPSHKSASPKSPSPKLPSNIGIRHVKQPIYINDFKYNKPLLYKENYVNTISLSNNFLQLFDDLKIKGKRQRSKQSKSPNDRLLKKNKNSTFR